MTFLTELERLLAAATKGPWAIATHAFNDQWENFNKIIHYAGADGGIRICETTEYSTGANRDGPGRDAQLICFLVNHADAIAELVRATKVMVGHEDGDDLQAELDAVNALAKLEGK